MFPAHFTNNNFLLKGKELNYKSVAKEVSKPPCFWLLESSGHQSLPCLFDSCFLLSAYEVKNNSRLFERLFKVKMNSVFLFGISFFVLEILTFSHYANDRSDDVIDHCTKTVQHSLKNISGNIKAVFLKLGTRNVHHKRKNMTAVMLLP